MDQAGRLWSQMYVSSIIGFRITSYFYGKKTKIYFVFISFCPHAGLALPFPIDEKEAKILSKRTLGQAF